LGWGFSVVCGLGFAAGCGAGVDVGVGVGVAWTGVTAGVVAGAGAGVIAVCGAGVEADFALARWRGACRMTGAARPGANSDERTRSAGGAVSESPTGAVWAAGRACDAGRGAAVPCFIPATMA
jgi:hypothetical protein